MLHLGLLSVVDRSTLNWCEHNVQCEAMSDVMFAKTGEPDMTAVIFNKHFRDRLG